MSIAKKARVDMGFMQGLTGFTEEKIASDLTGVIFRNPQTLGYEPADEALEMAQPKDLDASEISVRLGSTWVDKHYVQ